MCKRDPGGRKLHTSLFAKKKAAIGAFSLVKIGPIFMLTRTQMKRCNVFLCERVSNELLWSCFSALFQALFNKPKCKLLLCPLTAHIGTILIGVLFTTCVALISQHSGTQHPSWLAFLRSHVDISPCPSMAPSSLASSLWSS